MTHAVNPALTSGDADEIEALKDTSTRRTT
jgi:hypothetical protein